MNGENQPREEAHFEERVSHLLEEARMILPGLQALFGFQLVSVFDRRFDEVLDGSEQRLYLVALVLIATAVGMVMTPAAYHRLLMPRRADTRFIVIGSWLLLLAMAPLVGGMSIDVYLIASVILGDRRHALAIALCVSALFVVLWLLLPLHWRRRSARARSTPRSP